MNCAYCGTELPPGAMFCGECGRSVTSQPAPQQVPAAARVQVEVVDLIEPGSAVPVAEQQYEPEPVPDVEPDIEPHVEPDLEPDVEPALEPVEPDLEPELAQAPEPQPAPAPAASTTCSQCGADLEASDIFCGECGFVRSAAVRQPDTAVLDPFPWGLPRSVEVEPVAILDDDIDETRIVNRSGTGARFVLQFSTGESVSVTGTGLLGRNPLAEPGEYFDSLVTITDSGKSVSKTHLEFGQESGTFWVSDRFSGNGTFVREPDRGPRRCDPGKRYRISRGTRVDIGEQFFIVS